MNVPRDNEYYEARYQLIIPINVNLKLNLRGVNWTRIFVQGIDTHGLPGESNLVFS